MTKNITISSLFCAASLTSYLLFAQTDAAKNNNIIYLHEQKAKHRSPESLFEALTARGNVIIIFYADWCNPCKRSAPIVDQLAEILTNFKLVKVNAEMHKKLYFYYTEKHGMKGIPSFLFFKDGKLIEVYSKGPKTVEEWTDHINNLYGTHF